MREVPLLSGAGLLGHLQDFRDRPLDLLRRFNDELGDLGRMRFGATSVLVLNTPALVHELLVKQHAHLQKSRILRAALYPLAGDGLFTSDGDLWRRQRKLMAPIFQAARIAEFDTCMTDCAARCVDAWSEGQMLDALHETTAIAMNVASQALFDTDTSGAEDELGEALTVALEWAAESVTSAALAVQVELADGIQKATSRLPGALGEVAGRAIEKLERPIMWPTAKNQRLQTALAILDAHVDRMIAERRENPGRRKDLLSRLLTSHLDVDDESAMSDKQLRDEILTLFVAGHETTATALAWSLYLLARHPEIREALEREVDDLGGETPTAADLPRLGLATRIFEEALRLYPPVPIYERQAIEPFELGGVSLDVGEYIGIFPWALHHRDTLWPDPEGFDPDRFLPKAKTERDRYAWIPFGAGPRVCIGNHFAMQEGPLVLATIVRRARLELREQTEIAPDPHAATLRPLGGVPMQVRLRTH